MRVLVVEDEEKIAQFLKKGLTEKGYTVEAVGDPDSARQSSQYLYPCGCGDGRQRRNWRLYHYK